MVNIRTKEISATSEETVDVLVNEWLEANVNGILEIVDIKYHTQLTDNASDSSVLVIYRTHLKNGC